MAPFPVNLPIFDLNVWLTKKWSRWKVARQVVGPVSSSWGETPPAGIAVDCVTRIAARFVV